MGQRNSIESFGLLYLNPLDGHVSPLNVEEVSSNCEADVE